MKRSRLAVLIAASLAAFALAPAAEAHMMWCGGIAPASTACNGLTHTVTGFISHGPWLEHMTNYTGTVESRLDYAGGFRSMRCDFQAGQWQKCKREGEFPNTGVSFAYSCKSYLLGTTTLGGVGNWQCRLSSH